MESILLHHSPAHHAGAIAVALCLHLALVYALLAGMTSEVARAIWKPVQVRLVDMVEPPPPAPGQLPLPAPPTAPAPLYVPPPIVRVAPPPAPLVAVTTTPPLMPVISTPPVGEAVPAAPVPAPAPAPPPRRTRPRAATLDVSHCMRSAYPMLAVRQEATGTTRIRFKVDANGHVESAQLVRGSGFDPAHRALDQAAIEALGQCAFNPGTDDDGRPIGGDALVDYVWKLDK